MAQRIIHRLSLCASLIFTGLGVAGIDAPSLPAALAENPAPRPIAVIYFNDGSDISREHAQMVESMVKEAGSNFHLKITDIALPNEGELAGSMERIADDDIGLVIIVEPQDIEGLSKIPGLYPDIDFSIIGARVPLYFSNVRSMLFKEQEGHYMMGVLAALRTATGSVSYISKSDTPATRNLAYAFLQGVKNINPELKVTQQLGTRTKNGKSSGSDSQPLPDKNADVVFVESEELLQPVLQNTKAMKRYIITNNHNLTSAYPGHVLTSLLKHYDLAMYQTIRSYSRSEWKPGSQSMGIDNGYIDYVLNNANKADLPKETIEQIEKTKDFVSQGIVQINALAP